MCTVHCVYSQKGHGNIFFDTVVVFTPEYEAFEVKRKEHFKPYLDTINMLEKELSDHYYRIPHKSDSTTIAKWEIKRIDYEKNIEKYVEFANSLSAQYFQEHRPIFKSWLQKYLDEFCQKNGFNSHEIILEDKRCTDCNDYTEEFINFLKEEYL
jgi:hypothetical protein